MKMELTAKILESSAATGIAKNLKLEDLSRLFA
jgi:hypothetical protein